MKIALRTSKLLAFLACFTLSILMAAEDHKPPADGKGVAQVKGFKNVSVEEFDKLRGEKKNQVLDVRTAQEFSEGHIPGAINMDINGPDFDKKVAALDKDKTYLVNCAGGGRSARACGKMNQLNFPHLYNLEKGFKSWEKAGKPVEK